MPRLSSLIENLQPHYSVVVIGSGYGGAIAASRLARAGQQVCVLERGLEFQPGEYPNTLPEILAQTQVDTPDAFLGSRTGLYDMRMSDDINVFCGCGLGGTSLVNANVSLPAEPRVFDDPRWPAEFRADVRNAPSNRISARTRDARRHLPIPTLLPRSPSLQALEKSAGSLKEKFYRPPINVTFKDGVNPAGVEQTCLHALRRLHYRLQLRRKEYRPDELSSRRPQPWRGDLYPGRCALSPAKKDGFWVIHYQVLDSGRERFDTPTQFVTATIVVLAAGCSARPRSCCVPRPMALALGPGRHSIYRKWRCACLRIRYRHCHRRNRLWPAFDPQGAPPWDHASPGSSTIVFSPNWTMAW